MKADSDKGAVSRPHPRLVRGCCDQPEEKCKRGYFFLAVPQERGYFHGVMKNNKAFLETPFGTYGDPSDGAADKNKSYWAIRFYKGFTTESVALEGDVDSCPNEEIEKIAEEGGWEEWEACPHNWGHTQECWQFVKCLYTKGVIK